MRILRWIGFLSWMTLEIIRGTAQDVAATFKHHSKMHPAIVELPLRCHTDLEVALMAWAITIPPGTAVIAIAAAHGDSPPTMFIHSLHQDNEHDIIEDLRDLETRLLRVLRKDFQG